MTCYYCARANSVLNLTNYIPFYSLITKISLHQECKTDLNAQSKTSDAILIRCVDVLEKIMSRYTFNKSLQKLKFSMI